MKTIAIICLGYVGSAVALKLFHNPPLACAVLAVAVVTAWLTRDTIRKRRRDENP